MIFALNAIALTLTLTWTGEAGKDVDFFPDPESVLVISDIRVDSPQDATKPPAGPIISFKATVLRGKSLMSPRLAAVIAYTDARGIRRGVSLNIPLRPQSPGT